MYSVMMYYLILFLIIAGGAYIVCNLRCVKYRILYTINYIFDIYLDYKYANYHHNQSEKLYRITNIILHSSNQLIHVPVRLPIDLRYNSFKLEFDQLVNLLKTNDVYKSVIYVYFIYGDDEYILPITNITGGMLVEFPIYSANDLDSCMKLEYDHVSTNRYDSDHDDILPIINKYAGPKGNFFSDTQYRFTPELILCDTQDSIMCNADDFIKLTTMMGNSVICNGNELITIDNIF